MDREDCFTAFVLGIIFAMIVMVAFFIDDVSYAAEQRAALAECEAPLLRTQTCVFTAEPEVKDEL